MVAVPKLTLTYFNFGARGEPLRLAAAIGKIPFVHKAIEPKKWPEIKPTMPLGQMPLLEIEEDGKEKQSIVQSVAILRYLGKLGNLYPTDPIQAIKVDSLMDTASEATRSIEMSIQGPVNWLIAEEPWSKNQVMAIRKRIATDQKHGLPFYLSYFENALQNNGTGWLVGNSITIADLLLHRITSWVGGGMLDGIPTELLDNYPAVKQHNQKVEALPAVQQWRAEYPMPYNDFAFEPTSAS